MHLLVEVLLAAATSAAQVVPDVAPSSTDILQKVDAFYATSWSHLVLFTTILVGVLGVIVGIVGVVVPIVLQRAQERTFKHEASVVAASAGAKVQEDFEALARTLEKKVEDARALIAKETEHAVAEVRAELKRDVARADARSYVLQGNVILNAVRAVPADAPNRQAIVQTGVRLAASSFAKAIPLEAQSGDLANLRVAATNLCNCLTAMTGVDFQEDPGLDDLLPAAQVAVETADTGGACADLRAALRKAIQQARSRPSPPAAADK